MQNLIYNVKPVDIESLVSRLNESPHAEVAKSLLRVWSFLRLDYPLPLFIFDQNLLLNIEKPRKDLVSSLPILQSAEAVQNAVATLLELGVIKYVNFPSDMKLIRLADVENTTEMVNTLARVDMKQFMSGAYDDFLVEMAQFAYVWYPRCQLAVLAEFMVERLHPHAFNLQDWLISRFESGKASESLKNLLNSDDFLHFCFSLHLHTANAKNEENSWAVYHLAHAIRDRFTRVEKMLRSVTPQFEDRSIHLRFEWQVIRAFIVDDEETELLLMAFAGDYLDANKDTLTMPQFVFAQAVRFVLSIGYKNRGFPDPEQIRVTIFNHRITNEEIRAKSPSWHDDYIILHFMLLSRLSMTEEMTKLQQEMVARLAHLMETENLPIPFFSELKAPAELIQAVEITISDDADVRKRQFQNAADWLLRLTPTNHTSRAIRDAVFAKYRGRINDNAMIDYALLFVNAAQEYYGFHSPEYPCYVASGIHVVASVTDGQFIQPQLAQWIDVAFQCTQRLLPNQLNRLIDIHCRLSQVSIWLEQPDLKVLPATVRLAMDNSLAQLSSVAECVSFFCSVGIRTGVSEKELLDFIAEVDAFVQRSSSISGLIAIKASVPLARALIDLELNRPQEALQNYRMMMIKYSRDPALKNNNIMKRFAFRVCNKLWKMSERLGQDVTKHPATIEVFRHTLSYYIYGAVNHHFALSDEVFSEMAKALITLSRTGQQQAVQLLLQQGQDMCDEHALPHFHKQVVEVVSADLREFLKTSNPAESSSDAKTSKNKKSKKTGKKNNNSASKLPLSTVFAVVGGAAAVGMIGAISLFKLVK